MCWLRSLQVQSQQGAAGHSVLQAGEPPSRFPPRSPQRTPPAAPLPILPSMCPCLLEASHSACQQSEHSFNWHFPGNAACSCWAFLSNIYWPSVVLLLRTVCFLISLLDDCLGECLTFGFFINSSTYLRCSVDNTFSSHPVILSLHSSSSWMFWHFFAAISCSYLGLFWF